MVGSRFKTGVGSGFRMELRSPILTPAPISNLDLDPCLKTWLWRLSQNPTLTSVLNLNINPHPETWPRSWIPTPTSTLAPNPDSDSDPCTKSQPRPQFRNPTSTPIPKLDLGPLSQNLTPTRKRSKSWTFFKLLRVKNQEKKLKIRIHGVYNGSSLIYES